MILPHTACPTELIHSMSNFSLIKFINLLIRLVVSSVDLFQITNSDQMKYLNG